MNRETRLVRGGPSGLDRATIHSYVDGRPGTGVLPALRPSGGLEAERLLGRLEGGHALLFPSGSAATTALVLGMLGARARKDSGRAGRLTSALLGRRVPLAAGGSRSSCSTRPAAPPAADLVWLEPCSNPMLSFPDLDEAIAAAHCGRLRASSSTTPCSARCCCGPLEHGADFVMHSASKIIAGHHDALLGVVTCARADDHARLGAFRGETGIVAAPDPVWLMLRGLKTLALRVERQSASALELARRLAAHPAVERVRYPGLGDPVAARYVKAFGPLLSFDVADADHAASVERRLKLIENATSLGGVASTLEARVRWEGSRVPAGLLRLSVGLEDVEDLWADLTGALDG